ncbi:hypothetical protein [Aquimarina sediminis]|uniref:hypothetical protein n=1 Tax=Aquimarina sediminis TaxID=2070536 RepID=UPI000FFEC90A|nr:hypothetical protein [Aquimarina sediminis]
MRTIPKKDSLIFHCPQRYMTFCDTLPLASFQSSAIEKLHLKEINGATQVEFFVRKKFDALSDIQLTYYHYYKQISNICDNF